jgi:FtsP/CotA-like multicopper oxidase with cupredoxin domain
VRPEDQRQSHPHVRAPARQPCGDPETEWLINGLQFEADKPLISVTKGSGAVWRIRNGGGGWVHPMHLHMEEHTVSRATAGATPTPRHPDDTAKEDVIALDPSEDTVISRRFRTFTGPYVATATTWPTRTTT